MMSGKNVKRTCRNYPTERDGGILGRGNSIYNGEGTAFIKVREHEMWTGFLITWYDVVYNIWGK